MKEAKADVQNPRVVTMDNSSSKPMANGKPRVPMRDRMRGLILSVSLQSALQIAAGTFVACLFTFVRPISFPQSCAVATLFLVVSVMSSPNNHLGTRINAAAGLVGCTWIGAVPAAVVATIAKIPGPGAASTGIYMALGAVAIALLSINRVGSSPPTLWRLGMTSCLAFGLVALSTWKLQTIVQVWSITGYLVLVSVISAVVSTLAAALVMPTLATEQVHHVLADVLHSAGLSTSRYAASLFRARARQQTCHHQQQQQQHDDRQHKDAYIYGAMSAVALEQQLSTDGNIELSTDEPTDSGDHADRMYALGDTCAAFVLEDTMTESEWLQLMQRNSSPNPPENPNTYKCPMPVAGVGMLRPKLAEVQNLLLPAAAVEPHWLRGPSSLICAGHSHWFDAAAWGKVVGVLQVLVTRLSALEAVIEDGESLHESGGWISSPELLSCLRLVYSQTATSLALMACTVRTHNKSDDPAAHAKATDGNFCVMVGAFGAGLLRAKEELTVFMKSHTEMYWERMMAAAPGSPITLPSLTNVRHLMFSWVLTNSIITATEQLERALAAAVCNAPPPGLHHRLIGWMLPLWPLLSGRHLFANWYKVLLVDLPAAMKQGSAAFTRLLPQPIFQAGVKYWAVLVLVYVATLMAMHFDSAIATLTPAFGYVAAVLTMSERVEATVSKVSFWLAGTIVGGGLGCLAMWHPAVATNPYALMAIMVVAAFLVGLLGQTRGRVAITLTLMTLSALILCQYNGVVPGKLEVALARVAVLAGVLTTVVICNMVLPWYTSTWAIQTMCHVYEHSIQLLCELVAKSYQQGAEAVAAAAQPHPQGLSAAVATAADLAATLATAAAESFPDAAACSQARDPGDPAALQTDIGRPLVAVQVSLMRDTVAWQKGVLATPPIVRELLKSLQALADRLAALQLALKPPKVTGIMTGAPVLYFGVPLRDHFVHLFELHGILAAAVAAAVQHPESRTHANAIRVLVKSIEQHRISMYRTMTQLRRDLHVRALQQQDLRAAAEAYAVAAAGEDCSTALKASHSMRQQLTQYFGTADDAVAYLGFQFALLKAVDKAAAVAKLVLADFC